MGRVFFPTQRSNILGVRDVSSYRQLAGEITVPRPPALPYPHPAMNPTGPMLGAVTVPAWTSIPVEPIVHPGRPIFFMDGGGGTTPPVRMPNMPAPVQVRPLPVTVVSPQPGAPPTAPATTAPPVSSQTGPTPTVTIPQADDTSAPLISSGGGTVTPATSSITVQTGGSGDIFNQIAAWLSGTTPLMGYAVPNGVIAAAVVLGVAWLSGGNAGGRRR
jgi:hypothetical protein